MVPSSALQIAAPTVKTSVLRSEDQNAELSSAALKFSRPTNRATGSPTLASLIAR